MSEDRSADMAHVKWAKGVKERDSYVCQICRAFGVILNSHHLNSYDLFIDQRYDLSNGITLCNDCHHDFHAIYGKGKNTAYQFNEFIKIREFLVKLSTNQEEEK